MALRRGSEISSLADLHGWRDTEAPSNSPEPMERRERRERRLAEEARSYIRNHFANPNGCSTGDVADLLGISPSHLCHLYRANFGRTVGEEIRYHRIKKARRLLRQTDLLIKEVAAESGYLHSSYRAFLNAFRAETGIPPSTYRQHLG